jgi:hypothetical protein
MIELLAVLVGVFGLGFVLCSVLTVGALADRVEPPVAPGGTKS